MRKGTVEKGDFAVLELGPPDISIQNMEERTYFVVVLFLGGGGECDALDSIVH